MLSDVLRVPYIDQIKCISRQGEILPLPQGVFKTGAPKASRGSQNVIGVMIPNFRGYFCGPSLIPWLPTADHAGTVDTPHIWPWYIIIIIDNVFVIDLSLINNSVSSYGYLNIVLEGFRNAIKFPIPYKLQTKYIFLCNF